MLSGRAGVLAAFLIAVIVIAAQLALKRADRLQPDELSYVAVATKLVATGTFTDGSMSPDGVAGKPGRFFAPAYPVLLGALAMADAGFGRALICLESNPKAVRSGCGALWTFHAMQIAIAAIGMAAIFLTARRLGGSDSIAWTTMLIALATGEPATYARLMLTDTLAFTTIYVSVAALVMLACDGKVRDAVIAGSALGFATLSRPGYIYLLYAVAIVIPIVALLWPRVGAAQWWHGAIVIGSGIAVLSPWMMRNHAQFGDAALTAGYGPFTLVQRVAYNAMTWPEWGAAWIFWLPDVGDDLAKALFRAELVGKLGFNAPDTYYKLGAGPLMAETLSAAGGPQRHLDYLLKTYVLGDPVKHVAVTLVLAWRGFWAGKWLGVLALVLAWPVIAALFKRAKLTAFLALALPLLFTLGLHAFVSVNIVRYNIPLIALFAFIVAYAANEAWTRWRSSDRGKPA